MSLIVNRRDLDFLLYEVQNLESLLKTDHFSDYDQEDINAILDLAQGLGEEVLLPFAAKLDSVDPKFVDGKVETIPELKAALDQVKDAGLFATCFDADLGGMQLPLTVHQSLSNILICANAAPFSYVGLTQAAANLLSTCGSEELKRKYLPKMVSGDWFGTMCLSEPHAGSSLADIRTKAEPLADGSYKITGTKMWITGGDQDVSENIIEMVLARTPNSPAGIRGISLFLVPKIRVNDDGSLGEHNNIALAGLNHKMGNRGSTNCLLNFGEKGDSIGYLLGEENQGLANMFHMMNEARLFVGQAATIAGLAGYLYSLDYARQRPQGRPIGNKDPELPQVMISEHADVKRMLMTQKAFVEGAQCLMLYCAELIDRQKTSNDPAEHQRLALLLEILTPIAKSWPAEFCLEANKLAIQVLGGYGYTREYPVERFYRENRLNHIHEGTWAIHGIDILGRKVSMHDGAALTILNEEMNATMEAAKGFAELSGYCDQLRRAMSKIDDTVAAVQKAPNPGLGLANATLFLDAAGHAVVAWMWLKQAVAALKGLELNNDADKDFYTGKLAACQFFYRYELPKNDSQLDLVASLDSTCYDLKAEQFVGV